MTATEPITLVGVAGSCKGVTYRVQGPVVTIGSAKASDFKVTGRLVSEMHATLDIGPDGGLTLRNRSNYGTFVNREAADVRQLRTGDQIQIGEGGIVEVRFGRQTAGRTTTGISTKTKLIAAFVGIYLVAMVGLMVYLATQSTAPATVSGDTITAALAKTRAQLLDKAWWQGPVAPSQSVSDLDPSAAYYAIQGLVANAAPAEQVSAVTDTFLQHLQEMFQDARILEQRERWKDARTLYHQIIEAAPDTRLAVTQLANARLTKLDRLNRNAK